MLGVAVSLLVALVAAFTDARTGRIPNWLTLGGVGGGWVLGGGAGGLSGLGLAFVSTAIAASPWLTCYWLGKGGVGGGDVKLFAAFGALLGAERALELALTALVLTLAAWTLRMGLRRRAPSLPGIRTIELRLGPPVLVALLLLTLARFGGGA